MPVVGLSKFTSICNAGSCSTSKAGTLQVEVNSKFCIWCTTVFLSALKWHLMYQNWSRNSNFTIENGLKILIILFCFCFFTISDFFSSTSKEAHSRKSHLSMCSYLSVFVWWTVYTCISHFVEFFFWGGGGWAWAHVEIESPVWITQLFWVPVEWTHISARILFSYYIQYVYTILTICQQSVIQDWARSLHIP